MATRAILEEIKKLTVVELAELVKAIEEEFNVSAAAPMAFAGAAVATEAAAPVSEKTEFKVTLTEVGAEKIKVIRALRAVNPDLGMKETKDATESTPYIVRESVSKDEAAKIKQALEEAGATVTLS